MGASCPWIFFVGRAVLPLLSAILLRLRSSRNFLLRRSLHAAHPCTRPASASQAREPDRDDPASCLAAAQPLLPRSSVRCMHLTLPDFVRCDIPCSKLSAIGVIGPHRQKLSGIELRSTSFQKVLADQKRLPWHSISPVVFLW
jgi:hypothetical protein